MCASARYNAFCWLTGAADAVRTVDEAADYHADEYRTMFGENVGELRPVYQGEAPPERPQ
jgi:hypothetical protein